MKYYITSKNEVMAVGENGDIDGDQSLLVQSDWKLMTAEEVKNHLNPPKTEEQILAEQKAEIKRQLEELTVTTSKGNTFDANSQARLDISNGILASQALGVIETVWRLADDTEVLITVEELKEALVLALQEYARVKGIGA